MRDLHNELKSVSTRLRETNEALDKVTAKMDGFMDKADIRFAGKWTEKILIFVGSAMAIAVIGAFMSFILKHPTL
jgi:hypothetical protein